MVLATGAGAVLNCERRSPCMDIKNILNKDGAPGDQKNGKEGSEAKESSSSDKSNSKHSSPKSTASAPAATTSEGQVAIRAERTPSAQGGPAPLPPPSHHAPLAAPPTVPRGPSYATIPITRDFECSTCKKAFARRSDLVRHGTSPLCLPADPIFSERIHSGLRCDTAFSRIF
jgi:hypothetical protein